MAFSILCQHWEAELDCFAELMAVRPVATPNALVVAWADELLARDGKMKKAILPDPFAD